MTPQRRGLVPPDLLARIKAAQSAAVEADEEVKSAVADALKADASVREIAAATGLSTNTVQKWGRDRGWPTQEQLDARAAAKAPIDEFTARLRASEANLRAAGIDPETGDDE